MASAALWGTLAISSEKISTPPGSDISETKSVILEPKNWLNKPFAFFDDVEGSAPLRKGRWLVVFYHYDCDSCIKAIPKYMIVANSGKSFRLAHTQIAFIAMPPAPVAGQDPVPVSANYLHLNLSPVRDWFATTPVVAAVQDGIVLWAGEGDDAVDPPNISVWRW